MTETLNCDDVMRQLWDYLDGELTVERMEAVKAHLAVCHRCFPQYEFEREYLRLLAGLRREHPDLAALRSGLLASLKRAGFAAP